MTCRPQIRIDARAFLVETRILSTVEVGAYALLAMHFAWHKTLPADDRDLARIALLPLSRWRKMKETVLHLTKEWASSIEFRGSGADDYACTYCGDIVGPFECDHVKPVARGGPSTIENLTTACFTCNRSKRDKTVEEWLA